MPNYILNAETEVNQALLDEFKIQEGVRMVSQLPDCDDCRVSDLPNEGGISTVSKRVYVCDF